MKFSKSTLPSTRDKWQVSVNGIGVTGENATHIPLIDTYATFALRLGFSFPQSITRGILQALEAESYSYVFPRVDCAGWDDMPELVFAFADCNITLTRDDYALRTTVHGSEICTVLIADAWDDPEAITIGIELLRKFFVVFDMEEDELRCELEFLNIQASSTDIMQ